MVRHVGATACLARSCVRSQGWLANGTACLLWAMTGQCRWILPCMISRRRERHTSPLRSKPTTQERKAPRRHIAMNQSRHPRRYLHSDPPIDPWRRHESSQGRVSNHVAAVTCRHSAKVTGPPTSHEGIFAGHQHWTCASVDCRRICGELHLLTRIARRLRGRFVATELPDFGLT